MSQLTFVIELTILVLAAFLGFEVISKVPTMLHTPLMSGTNFIHGIVIVGRDHHPRLRRRHVHEDRRLRRDGARDRERRRRLVRDRPHARDVQAAAGAEEGRHVISDPDVVGLLYLVAIVCFVLALRFLSSPKHARRGNWLGGVGMLVAIATTLLIDGISNWALIVVAAAIGSVVGLVGARKVKMTAMPQMVALFNGVGGGAAALVALAEFHELDGVLVWDEALSDRALRAHRLDLVRGLARRLREAAGARQRPPDRLPGPERREHRWCSAARRRSASRSSPGSRRSGRSSR